MPADRHGQVLAPRRVSSINAAPEERTGLEDIRGFRIESITTQGVRLVSTGTGVILMFSATFT